MRRLRDLLQRWPGWLIFSVAAGLRLVWVLTLDDVLHWPDEHEFVAIARSLMAGDGFISTSYRAAPVYPAYLAGILWMFSDSLLAARASQAVLGALTCVLLCRTGTRLGGRGVGLLSGGLLAVYLPHVFLSGVFYVECLYTLLVVFVVHCAVRAGWQPRIPTALVCGAVGGLTILTRPIFGAYLPFIALGWAYAAWPAWRRAVVPALVLTTTAALVVGPWAVRNRRVFGQLLPVTSGLVTTLWQGNNELARGDADDRLMYWGSPAWQERLQSVPPAVRAELTTRYAAVDRHVERELRRRPDRYLVTDAVLRPLVWERVTQHPAAVARLGLAKLATLFTAFTPTDTQNVFTSRRNQLLASLSSYPLLALAGLGALLARLRPRPMVHVYLFLVTMAGAYALLTACTRFRLPMDPYLILFGSLALVWLRERVRCALANRRVARPIDSAPALPVAANTGRRV